MPQKKRALHFTEEQIKESEARRKTYIEETRKRKDWQIGILFGELVWRRMPTLSTNRCGSGARVQVSKEDEDKLNELSDKWYNNDTKENWVEYRTFAHNIEDRYLKKEFKFMERMPWIEINDEFKKGLISFLWNTDGCEYSLNEEDITMSADEYFIIINFIYRKNEIIYGK